LWVVSHKPVAVAAGMGRMGIHRNIEVDPIVWTGKRRN